MTTIDIIIIALFLLGAIAGLVKGFLKQLATLAGLIVGLIAAKLLYIPLSEWFCPAVTEDVGFARILAFVLVWVAVPLVFILLGALLTKAVKAIALGWLNRWLGAGLGALKMLLLLSVLMNVLEYADPEGHLVSRTKREESVLYEPVRSFAGIFIPAARQVTEQLVDDNNLI